MTIERRSDERKRISRPVVYAGTDGSAGNDAQGVGLALDISPSGMMLESDAPIDARNIRVRATTRGGASVEVDGVLIYSMPYSSGRYRTGLKFAGPDEQVSTFVAELGKPV